MFFTDKELATTLFNKVWQRETKVSFSLQPEDMPT